MHTDTIKQFICTTCLSVMASLTFAQAEPGTQAKDLTLDISQENAQDKSAIQKTRSVEEIIQDFLNKRDWAEGPNSKNGNIFIIHVGYGTILAPASNPNYNTARQRAFDRAILSAKAQMASTLAQEISAAVTYSYSEQGESDSAEDQANETIAKVLAEMPDDSIIGKAKLLISKKLDNALKGEGYDIAMIQDQSQQKIEDAQKVLDGRIDTLISSTSFKRDAQSIATCAISGLQAFYTAESQPLEGGGSVGVVAIWSPTLAEMAYSISTGKSVSFKPAKKPIREQVSSDPALLLSTFGVTQKINEHGELTLVSYAQSGARTKSTQSKRAAYNKARLLAQVQIRQFAGEIVSTDNLLKEAESQSEFENNEVDYSDESSYREFQASSAKALVCNGISQLKTWRAIHPISQTPVYGTICTWSPSAAERARTIKGTIEKSATQAALGVSSVQNNPSHKTSPSKAEEGKTKPSEASRQYEGFGSSGDDDAF